MYLLLLQLHPLPLGQCQKQLRPSSQSESHFSSSFPPPSLPYLLSPPSSFSPPPPPSPTGLPVAPKRTKRKSAFPDQLEASIEQPHTVSHLKIPPPLPPTSPHPPPPLQPQCPPPPPPPLMVVVALYDCDPDQRDELGFKEGQRIIVTAKTSKEWWVSKPSSPSPNESFHACSSYPQRGYVEGAEGRDGLFPVNYVQ